MKKFLCFILGVAVGMGGYWAYNKYGKNLFNKKTEQEQITYYEYSSFVVGTDISAGKYKLIAKNDCAYITLTFGDEYDERDVIAIFKGEKIIDAYVGQTMTLQDCGYIYMGV